MPKKSELRSLGFSKYYSATMFKNARLSSYKIYKTVVSLSIDELQL